MSVRLQEGSKPRGEYIPLHTDSPHILQREDVGASFLYYEAFRLEPNP